MNFIYNNLIKQNFLFSYIVVSKIEQILRIFWLITDAPGKKQVLYVSVHIDRTTIRTGTSWQRCDVQWILTWWQKANVTWNVRCFCMATLGLDQSSRSSSLNLKTARDVACITDSTSRSKFSSLLFGAPFSRQRNSFTISIRDTAAWFVRTTDL